jgi:RHS repeat-associated protein
MGNVQETDQYDPFGSGTGSALTRYDFTGRERDPDTGLIYSRARWYDPTQGRFLSQDPEGPAAGLDLYTYVRDYPVGYTDPFGLMPSAGAAPAPAPAPIPLPVPAAGAGAGTAAAGAATGVEGAATGAGAAGGVGLLGTVGLGVCAFVAGVGVGLAIGQIPTGGGKNVNDRVQDFFTDTIWGRPESEVQPVPVPIPQTQTKPCPPGKEADCQAKFEADNDVCRSLPNRTKRQKAIRSRCWNSAVQRLGACRQNLPLPPLITW